MVKNVAFWSNQLCERGTEVALFDYASFNETILGNRSHILFPRSNPRNKPAVVQRFQEHFQSFTPVSSFESVNQILEKLNVEYFYIIKHGKRDGLLVSSAKNCVHAVFTASEPHGDFFATISPDVPGNQGKYPVVPHMVSLPNVSGDLRDELAIPPSSTVFGGFGGPKSFDIEFVHRIVYQIAQKRSDVFFLFANFPQFCESLPNILHLPCIYDQSRKARFINTCDAMLWARSAGETFGLAIAEFSSFNKPVIAAQVGDLSHVRLLGEKAFWYSTQDDLKEILEGFNRSEVKTLDWNAFREYRPQVVMQQFSDVFLGG